MDPAHISELANNILQQFTPGNPGLAEILIDHYEQAIQQAGVPFKDDFEVKLLTGAYFSMEYAFESAALFNPSMVSQVDQPDLAEGRLHFVMSLRTVGEGHVSSITFRSGTIEDDGSVEITPADLEVHQLKRKENQTFKQPLSTNLAISTSGIRKHNWRWIACRTAFRLFSCSTPSNGPNAQPIRPYSIAGRWT
jgi:hypothetical protein